MSRAGSRVAKLEAGHATRRARRVRRDERQEEHEAVLREMSSTPEGREAVARIGELYIEGGGTLEALRSEGGREVISSFRDRFFEAAARVRTNDEREKGDRP